MNYPLSLQHKSAPKFKVKAHHGLAAFKTWRSSFSVVVIELHAMPASNTTTAIHLYIYYTLQR
jgi:hypothetical protein